jgi:MFS family permease
MHSSGANVMYQIENTGALLKGEGRIRRRRVSWPRVSRNVLLLGLTSMFTDVSSEMVATILPLYVVYTLGLSPLQFGVIDGLQNGASALVRLAGGLVGDRTRRHKEVAAFGYGLSAICKPAFLLAGSAWSALTAIVFVDRTGKGIRTAPRDALISLSVDRRDLAAAFGVHRALDTAGAMIGPLVAFALLALAPTSFDAIFVVSFCFALVGVSILVLFVQNRSGAAAETDPGAEPFSFRAAIGLLAIRPFQLLVLAGGGLALVTMSDAFLYLGLQRRLDFDLRLLPLLYVATAFVYMLLAVPVGRLADRHGRARVFVGGYVLLLLAYALVLLPGLGTAGLFGFLVLLGAYYAATDGVLMALASAVLPASLRGSGLALVVTATSLSRLAASIVFGAVWTFAGLEAAVVSFALALALALPLAAAALAHTAREAAHA